MNTGDTILQDLVLRTGFISWQVPLLLYVYWL